MNAEEMIQKARGMIDSDLARMQRPAYVKTIAWLHYLGLLRHNKIAPQRHRVELSEALEAGQLEPRVFELLPAIMVILPEALKYTKKDIPEDLAAVMQCIHDRRDASDFRGMPSEKYLHWLSSPIMNVARRRLDHKHMPRRGAAHTHAIGEVIRQGRMMLAMTQRQIAKEYGVSLRVLRDLEQGKSDASLKSVNDILKIFGRQLRA